MIEKEKDNPITPFINNIMSTADTNKRILELEKLTKEMQVVIIKLNRELQQVKKRVNTDKNAIHQIKSELHTMRAK